MQKSAIEPLIGHIVGIWTKGGSFIEMHKGEQALGQQVGSEQFIIVGAEDDFSADTIVIETEDVAAVRVNTSDMA